jgi:hypothetical protein
VADDFAALYNPLDSSGSPVIGGLLIWKQPLVQRKAAVTRFDSTKSTELPSTIAEARVEAFRPRVTFLSLRLHKRDPLRIVVAGIPRFTFTSRAMATSLITTNRVKSLVNQVPCEDFPSV